MCWNGQGTMVIGLFWYEDFGKMTFWLVLKLEISYNRFMIFERILVFFRGFVWRLYFIWVSIILPFCLKILFYKKNVNGKATMWHTPSVFSFLLGRDDWDVEISVAGQLLSFDTVINPDINPVIINMQPVFLEFYLFIIIGVLNYQNRITYLDDPIIVHR
jgi:hypothetical protein